MPTRDERPSYGDLAVLVVHQAAAIEELRAENAELKRRLGTDSTHSSKPPSSDSRSPSQLRSRCDARPEVAGFDETGLRVAGSLHWAHCARTDRYTLTTCHPKRGTAGIDDAGVLGRFQGDAVHGAWAPYDTYVDVEHQLCCAHYADVGVMPTWWWGRWQVGCPGC